LRCAGSRHYLGHPTSEDAIGTRPGVWTHGGSYASCVTNQLGPLPGPTVSAPHGNMGLSAPSEGTSVGMGANHHSLNHPCADGVESAYSRRVAAWDRQPCPDANSIILSMLDPSDLMRLTRPTIGVSQISSNREWFASPATVGRVPSRGHGH
jgi:hypothetical protein